MSREKLTIKLASVKMARQDFFYKCEWSLLFFLLVTSAHDNKLPDARFGAIVKNPL